jgi:hypothetical protein
MPLFINFNQNGSKLIIITCNFNQYGFILIIIIMLMDWPIKAGMKRKIGNIFWNLLDELNQLV